jgi:hypothetical protein
MKATRRPPEGALAGENVPVENDEPEIEQALIEELATCLGQRPGYRRYDRDKRLELAKAKLREVQG